jgi:glycosyltransferase involved in cell wall biosynthesis
MECDKRKRKIIWIIDHYSSEPEYGGISRQYDFAKELDKREYNVVVFSSGFSHYTHHYISEKECYLTRPFPHVRYVYLKTTPYVENNGKDRAKNIISFMFQVLRYEKIIAKNYGKPDVVEGASVHPLAWIAAYRIAKKYKIRFVAEVRDFWPQVWVDSGRMKKTHPMAVFFSMIEKFTYKHADKIIYSLYHGERYICTQKGIPREKTLLLGQPMDCKRYDSNRERMDLLPEEIREFISSGFVCVFTGYYMEYEGVHVMLEAQKILEEREIPVKMLFVGSGQEKERMVQFVNENNLQKVLIGERISKESIPVLLTYCSICMAHVEYKGKEMALKYGVSMLKINDYLYSGNPILFGFRFKDNEVVESRGGLQFEPYNAKELAEKIEYLYGMPDKEREKFGIEGKAYMQKYHDVEVLTDKFLDVLFS